MNPPKLIFEYCTPIWPPAKSFHYRVVMDSSGYFRVEKKGIASKKFRVSCWGGTAEQHYSMAVYVCRRKRQ